MKRNGTIRRDGDVANCGIALRRGRKRRCGRHVDSRTIRRCTDTREATETDRRFRLRHGAPRLAVFFPQACGKLSSAHTQCQTFLVSTKQSFVAARATRDRMPSGRRRNAFVAARIVLPDSACRSRIRGIRVRVNRRRPSTADPSSPESRPAARARARRSRPTRRRSRRAADRCSAGASGSHRDHRNCIAY